MHRHVSRSLLRLSLLTRLSSPLPLSSLSHTFSDFSLSPSPAFTSPSPSSSLYPPTSFRHVSTSVESGERAGLPFEYLGKKVCKLFNLPKLILKSEVVDYFEGCDLKFENVTSVIDERLRFQHWRIVFPSEESYERALVHLANRKKLGLRVPKMELVPAADLIEETDPRHPNKVADGFRGRSLVMLGGPEDIATDVIEKFFEGFHLAPNAIRHVKVFHEAVRTPLRMRLAGERRPTIDLMERRTLIKFQSPSECFRAYRELHREFLGDRPVELRIMQ